MKYTPDFNSRFRILKGGKISLVVSALLAGSTMSFAAPSGGSVTSGSATINQNGSVTTINQSTNKASINWQDFSIGKSETVNFVQPSSQSVTLNRVVGASQSLIEGAMNANGQVFLLNPNGVLFSNGSQINVGGLVASTLNITDTNFQAGNYVFEGTSQNAVLNMGTITANNGYVALMGKHVANEGTIVATMGNVQMASGEKISLNLNGNSLVKLTIDQGTMDALVENKGLIKADGGQVYLTTQALNTILDGMVNNTGIIEAKTLGDVTGKVVLFAHGGTANVGGTIDASAPNGGNGGFIETSGQTVNILPDSFVSTKSISGKTGTWLIDPNDFIVAATGGNMTGTQLSTMLSNTDFVIETSTMGNDGGAGNGDIFINDAVSWSANKLTLTAERNINVNAVMTMSGTASIDMGYGWNGATYGNTVSGVVSGVNMGFNSTYDGFAGKINLTSANSVFINGNQYEILTNAADMNAIPTGFTSTNHYYVFANDITSGMGSWSGKYISVGASYDFNGFGHIIDGLTYSLFTRLTGPSATRQSTVENLGLTNVNIVTADNTIGSIVGYGSQIKIKNSFVLGSITADYTIGGLAGSTDSSLIDNSFMKGTINTGSFYNGGLVGAITNSTISNSFAECTINNTGSNGYTGGLVGFAMTSTITDSYWKGGSINGGDYTGGLIGWDLVNDLIIRNSYAAGTINSTGYHQYGLTEHAGTNSYFISSLNANAGSMLDSANAIADPTALNSAIGSSYELLGGNTLPTLKPKYATSSITATPWTPPATPLIYTLSDITGGYTYTGTAITLSSLWIASALFGNTYSSWVAGTDYVFKDSGGNTVTSYTNAGTYSGLYIDILKSGYTEASSGNTAGSLVIDKAPLSVTANSVSKTYDGSAFTGGNGVTYSGFVGGDTASVLTGTVSYGGTSQGANDVGTYTITPSSLTSGNYTVAYVNGVLTINAALTPSPSPTNTVVQNQVNNVVTTVVNSTTVTPPAPIVVAPVVPQPQVQTQTQNNVLLQTILPQGAGTSGSFGLVGSTGGTSAVQTVSMDQLQTAATTQGIGEIRVPLANNSLVELVNGGVTLPKGVSQEFYVVAANTTGNTTGTTTTNSNNDINTNNKKSKKN